MNLKDTLKEEREEFDNKFVMDLSHKDEEDQYWNIVQNEAVMKNWLTTHDTRLLSALLEEIEGMKKDEMVFNRKLTEGGGHPDYQAIEFNKALDRIATIIKDVLK